MTSEISISSASLTAITSFSTSTVAALSTTSSVPPVSGSSSFAIRQQSLSGSHGANFTVTTHIPLTTIFTPPPSCTDAPFTFSTSHSGLSTFWRDAYGPGDGPNSACYPERFAYANNPTVSAIYSPGVCPSGYTGASSATNKRRGEMTSYCCPYTMSYAQDYGCFSTVNTPTVVQLNARTNVSMTTPFVAADYYIKVAWASSQLNLFTPRSAPLLTETPQARNTSTPGVNLSTAEKAGLGVGVPVGVCFAVAVAMYALWRRKRRRPQGDDASELMSERDEEKRPATNDERKRQDSTQVAERVDEEAAREQDWNGYGHEREPSLHGWEEAQTARELH